MTRREQDREIERLNEWIESQRPPVEPAGLREWIEDALGMLFIGLCGFVIVWALFAI